MSPDAALIEHASSTTPTRTLDAGDGHLPASDSCASIPQSHTEGPNGPNLVVDPAANDPALVAELRAIIDQLQRRLQAQPGVEHDAALSVSGDGLPDCSLSVDKHLVSAPSALSCSSTGIASQSGSPSPGPPLSPPVHSEPPASSASEDVVVAAQLRAQIEDQNVEIQQLRAENARLQLAQTTAVSPRRFDSRPSCEVGSVIVFPLLDGQRDVKTTILSCIRLTEQSVTFRASAELNGSSKLLALKCIIAPPEGQSEVWREVNVWRSAVHPDMQPLLGVLREDYENAGEHILASPWAENGNMLEYLQGHRSASRVSLITQVAGGLYHLHSTLGIVHGDVKCENVLINERGRPVLTDFGLSTFIQKKEKEAITATGLRTKFTVDFCAPELWIDEVYDGQRKRSKTVQTDVYAYGMLVLQAFTLRRPWPDQPLPQLVISVSKGAHPDRPGLDSDAVRCGLDDRIWHMCIQCWSHLPSRRPCMATILRDLRSASRACDGCRGRRYRCDGAIPACSSCESRNQACLWSQRVDKRRALDKAQIDELNATIERIENEQRSTAKGNTLLKYQLVWLEEQLAQLGLTNLPLPAELFSNPCSIGVPSLAVSIPDSTSAYQIYSMSSQRARTVEDDSPSGNGGGRHTHTRHASRACDGCRGRYRCDGAKPACSNCEGRNQACLWSQRVDKRRALDKAQADEVNATIERLENEQRRTAKENELLNYQVVWLKEKLAQLGLTNLPIPAELPNNPYNIGAPSLVVSIPDSPVRSPQFLGSSISAGSFSSSPHNLPSPFFPSGSPMDLTAALPDVDDPGFLTVPFHPPRCLWHLIPRYDNQSLHEYSRTFARHRAWRKRWSLSTSRLF